MDGQGSESFGSVYSGKFTDYVRVFMDSCGFLAVNNARLKLSGFGDVSNLEAQSLKVMHTSGFSFLSELLESFIAIRCECVMARDLRALTASYKRCFCPVFKNV